MTHLWKCDDCGKLTPIGLMGYIGSKDWGSERCDPGEALVQLCHGCVDNHNGLEISRLACAHTLEGRPRLKN